MCLFVSSDLQEFHTLPVLIVIWDPRLSLAILMVVSSTIAFAVLEDTFTERSGAGSMTQVRNRVRIVIGYWGLMLKQHY